MATQTVTTLASQTASIYVLPIGVSAASASSNMIWNAAIELGAIVHYSCSPVSPEEPQAAHPGTIEAVRAAHPGHELLYCLPLDAEGDFDDY